MVFHIRTILFYTIFRQRLRGPRISKVLALVLAFACAFTMFAGAASFTDQADIAVDSDVVDTMTALGVIEGYLDGSFRPDDTVTRGEMAKMIYVVRTGRSDASAYNDDATTFTDIGDHWARGYIKYCNSLGIIAGHSATRFAPDDTVTTQEAAKMLLVTLGYNAETAGLVGAGWGTKTNALADENGLLEDVVNGTTQALPRQYAAQLIYNAIFTPTVRLRDGEYTNMNDDGDYYPTIGERYMDLQSYETFLDYYRDGKAYFTSYPSGVSFNDYTADHSDLIDREVRVLYKAAPSSNNKATIYGIFEVGDFTYIDTLWGAVTDKKADTIEVDGEEYDIADEPLASVGAFVEKKSAHPVTVQLDENNDVYGIDTDTVFDVAEVTFVGTKTINITGISTSKSLQVEDTETYDGIAKDDWVVVSRNDYTDKDVLTEADVITGEVEIVNGDDITIDGEVYTIAADGDKTAASVLTTSALGDTVEAVVVDGYIYHAETVEGIASLNDVVYINGVKKDSSYGDITLTARAVFMDGTTEEIEISDGDSTAATTTIEYKASQIYNAMNTAAGSDASSENGLYAYEMDGDAYMLREIIGGPASTDDFDAKRSSADNATYLTAGDDRIAGMRVNDEAVVIAVDGDGDVSVLTGADVADWGAQTATSLKSVEAYANETNGVNYVELAWIVMNDTYDIPGVSGDDVYGYVVDTLGNFRQDNKTYSRFSVWTGSETETVEVEQGKTGGAVKGSFVVYDGDELDVIDTDLTNGTVTGLTDNDTIVLFAGNDGEYRITDDTQIIWINVEDTASAEGDSVPLATDVDGDGTDDVNVKYEAEDTMDDDAYNLKVVYVDSENDMLNVLK